MSKHMGMDMAKSMALAKIRQPLRNPLRIHRLTIVSGKHIPSFNPAVPIGYLQRQLFFPMQLQQVNTFYGKLHEANFIRLRGRFHNAIMRIGMTFVEEYPDPDNEFTRVYRIHRNEP